MAGSLNKVTIIGNLGRDPEIRALPSGGPVANFRVACSESWKDKDTGERKEKTEWITVTCFNEGICGVIEQYLKKGSKVYVEGAMRTRKYEKDGVEHYSTEVHIERFNGSLVLLDRREGGGQSDRDRQYDEMAQNQRGGGQRRSTGSSNDTEHGSRGPSRTNTQSRYNDLDDDIPFAPEWRI